MMYLWGVLAVLCCIVCLASGDIMRLDACSKFYAAFDVVYDNSLLTKTVFSLVENIVLNRCLIICVQYPKCKSFSYMFSHSQCRIHHSTRADIGTFLQKIVGWTHYETRENEPNLGRLCEVRKPCKYGRCVDTCDEKGYKCECKDQWVLLERNVCFGARMNEFATFKVLNSALLAGVKLVHVGGPGVTCMQGAIPSNWGCDRGEYIRIVITDHQNNTIFPSTQYYKNDGYFSVPGYNANSPYLIFDEGNHTVQMGEELRLHYSETLYGPNPNNNGGESCADIYVKLCDMQ